MDAKIATKPKQGNLERLPLIQSIAVHAYHAHNGKLLDIQKAIQNEARSDLDVLKSLCGSDLDSLINRKARQIAENVIRSRGDAANPQVSATKSGEASGSSWSLQDISELGGGQESSAAIGHGRDAATKNFPGHARRGASAIASVQEVVGNSLLDSFKIRDGRRIGDVMMRDLEALRGSNALEASVLQQLQKHSANAPANALVREVVTDATLAEIIEKAKVIADV